MNFVFLRMYWPIKAAQIFFLLSPNTGSEPACAITVHPTRSEYGFDLPDRQVHSRHIIDDLYQETDLTAAQLFYRPSSLFSFRSFGALHMLPSKELIGLENSITREVADHADSLDLSTHFPQKTFVN
jgi:hypothetical protein